MFESTSGGKKLQMPVLQGIACKCLLFIWLLLFGTAQSSTTQCCQENSAALIADSMNCTDGGPIQLHCPNGFYMFQPKFEPDEIMRVLGDPGNKTWLVIENKSKFLTYNISSDNYCLGKLEGDEDEEEIALICFPEQSPQPVWREICFGLFGMLSSVFLAITLIVYLILPEMRELQDKAMMSMIASFMVGFFLLSNQQLRTSPPNEDVTCLFVAFFMYYAYLSAFFWLNIISLNIWRSVWFPNLKLRCDILFIIYSAIGWGLPLCFLAVSLTTHHLEGYHLKPGFGEVNCWFNGYYATWIFFYGPIMILISMNLIYLSLTSWKLWHEYKELNCCKLKVLRFKCLMYIKLAILMGFTWIFEIISFASGETNQLYWILPDVLNALQGLFIFILLVVSRKRVRKLLAKKRPCNIPFPKSWAAYADEENCEPAGQEELELSQS